MKVIGNEQYRIYGPEARFSHDSLGEEFWQESVFLCWYDVNRSVGGVMRLGVEPNLEGGGVALWANVLTPDHAVYHRTNRLPYGPESRRLRGFSAQTVAGFDYIDEQRASWTLRDEGVSVDLEIVDLHQPVALFPESGSVVKDQLAKSHLECGVNVRGSVALAGRRYVIDGQGYRDHSWGIRHWTAIAGHRWLTGTLGDSRTFALTAWSNADGTIFKHGFICDYTADTIAYSNQLDELVYMETDGCSHRGGSAIMTMPDGTQHRFDFEPLTKGVISYYGCVACLDTPCRVRCDGLEGVGDFEISTNPHRGANAPSDDLVSAFIVNGLYRGDVVRPKRQHAPPSSITEQCRRLDDLKK